MYISRTTNTPAKQTPHQDLRQQDSVVHSPHISPGQDGLNSRFHPTHPCTNAQTRDASSDTLPPRSSTSATSVTNTSCNARYVRRILLRNELEFCPHDRHDAQYFGQGALNAIPLTSGKRRHQHPPYGEEGVGKQRPSTSAPSSRADSTKSSRR